MHLLFTMASNDVYGILYERMQYFHKKHQDELSALQEQCKKVKTIDDLHHLASQFDSLSHELHVHDKLEDKDIFPPISVKTNISQLENQHENLEQLLIQFENCSSRLKHTQNTEDAIKNAANEATSFVNQLATLIIEHENAEEQVIAPANMKKLFTEDEIKQLFKSLIHH